MEIGAARKGGYRAERQKPLRVQLLPVLRQHRHALRHGEKRADKRLPFRRRKIFRMRGQNDPGVSYLIEIDAGKLCGIRRAPLRRGERENAARRQRQSAAQPVERIPHLGKPRHAGRLKKYDVRGILPENGGETLAEISRERAAHAPRVDLADDDAALPQKLRVQTYLAKIVFDHGDRFVPAHALRQMPDERGFPAAEKARYDVQFCHGKALPEYVMHIFTAAQI